MVIQESLHEKPLYGDVLGCIILLTNPLRTENECAAIAIEKQTLSLIPKKTIKERKETVSQMNVSRLFKPCSDLGEQPQTSLILALYLSSFAGAPSC